MQHLVPCVGYVVAEKQSRLRLRAEVLDPLIAKNAKRLADVKEWPQLRGEPKALYRVRNGRRTSVASGRSQLLTIILRITK